ncbi:hypothetical protein M0722_10050 [Microbacterium sp. KSW4-16]|uniref:hypothetical protein n=1 Tax=Microbacterium TaxID=33882 RepID=UPI00103EDFB4|nr:MULTISPECIES: hypothetical protein [Microbacterium]MCK8467535.1 hypothetical protein [Microbacterium aurugineum]QEA28099.1 hypothetical protein FGL91_05705 [Microbacterium sp. CBA3102]TCJ22920.1 hypothetical protein E0W80_12035 [Microbacterium sp. PI-1]
MMTGAAIGDRIRIPRTQARLGVARRDITPPTGIRAKNWGPADWERSEGAHRPFELTALAVISSNDRPRLLLAVDGTWWRRVADEQAVRGAILSGLGLEPDQLMLSLSHTHAGAVLCAADAHLPGGELIPGYLEALAAAGIAAGREALDGAVPGLIEWTTGRCTLAADRELDVDGRPLVGYNPAGEADDTVMIGRLSVEGVVRGTLVNYACHPTTLAWQNREVSPDYVGAMREIVESATDAPCLFVQGASGELAPREQYTGDVTVADRHGRSLGHAVLAALDALPAPGEELTLDGIVESGAPLAIWTGRAVAGGEDAAGSMTSVELPLRELPTLDELAEEWKDIDPRSREERLGRARNLRDGYIEGPTVQHPVWAWRLGDAVIVGHPGEAYSRLQTTLRARFPETPIVLMNLTNGPGFVYLPTRDAYERGAYQAWQTPLAPGALDALEEHAVAVVADLLDR